MRLTSKEEIKKLSDADLILFETAVREMPSTDKLYNTRHTFATMTLVKGHTSPHNLAKRLGHHDSQMVHEVYAKFMHGNKFDFDLDINLY